MNIEGVFFDLDGTLVNALPFWKEANILVLQAHGVTLTDELYTEYIQNNHPLEWLLQMLGIDPSEAEKFNVERNKLYDELLEAKIEWIPNAPDLISHLREDQKMPIAIVTSAMRRNVDAMSRRLHFTELFGDIVTREELKKQKPDPEGIRLAAKRLQLLPEKVVYIGDQGTDVRAALDANASPILIPNVHTHADAHRDAHGVFQSISDLHTAFQSRSRLVLLNRLS